MEKLLKRDPLYSYAAINWANKWEMIYGNTLYASADGIDWKTSVTPSITSSDEEHCLVLEYTAWEFGIYLRTNQKINSVLVYCKNVHGVLSDLRCIYFHQYLTHVVHLQMQYAIINVASHYTRTSFTTVNTINYNIIKFWVLHQ
jgi:hypothetical protein